MPRVTTVTSVLNRKKHRDPWFLDEYTFNPYSSCAFNCLYCYIRGSKYGTNLETSLTVKTNAIEVLDKQLTFRAKKGQYGIIVLSSATDPYLKIEQEYQLTRRALEVILKHRFPVHMITKSPGIERDFDLLHQIDQSAILPQDLQSTLKRGTIITYSFSTLDDAIGQIFEPGAPSPSARLQALKNTVREGFLAGISMMPLLPFITDTTESLHNMFATFQETGAHYVLPATLTLFGDGKSDSKTLMLNAIQKHYPHLLGRYHQYFDHSAQMPQYYAHAFYRKMNELSAEYGLPNSILHGPE